MYRSVRELVLTTRSSTIYLYYCSHQYWYDTTIILGPTSTVTTIRYVSMIDNRKIRFYLDYEQ